MPKADKPRAGFAWQPPQEPEEAKPDWAAVAAELREHPYRWMKVYEHGRTSWAMAVSQGHVKALLPSDGFEYQTEHNTRTYPRRCTLYLRYSPDKARQAAEQKERE